jgi:hypothetical protein
MNNFNIENKLNDSRFVLFVYENCIYIYELLATGFFQFM